MFLVEFPYYLKVYETVRPHRHICLLDCLRWFVDRNATPPCRMEFILLALLLFADASTAFNIDTSKPIIFDHPKASKGKYFGYSVSLHSNNKKWLLVGAPLDDVPSKSDGNQLLQEYGAIYKCDPTNSKCSYIPVDNTPARKKDYKYQGTIKQLELEKKKTQWLGQVVHSSGRDGKVVTCAPRYTETPPDRGGTLQYQWILGRCFEVFTDLSESKVIINPCRDKRYGNNYYGYCQAGFSAQLTMDNEYIAMGALGVSNWKGGIAAYSHVYQGEAVFSTQDQIDKGYYMGYAVTSGYFGQAKKIGIAGGAPRAENMKGKVLIYQIESQLTVSATLPQPKNAKMGSYFGSVLCAMDLDKDGYTDILVGAPFYSDVKDEGHVFIYMNNKNGALNLMSDMELSGDKIVGAKFGSAIANVGNLNNDKFDDVAIGAPYEGNGAVYIYHGKANGIEKIYRQKILASQVHSGLSHFGHSLSGGIDVDDNGYPDMAAGAYGSDRAVILKTQKVINVAAQISLSVKRFVIENNKTQCKENDGTVHKCLNVTVCFATKEKNPTDLNISYKIELDQDKGSDALRRMYFYKGIAKSFVTTGTRLMVFSKKQTICLPAYTVHLREKRRLVDLLSVLTFDASFDLAHTSCKTNPNELCPVLNDYKPKLVRSVATFQKQCRSNDICKPDLSLTGNLAIPGEQTDAIHIGKVHDVTLMLDVKNKAPDAAYLAQVVISYPSMFDYIGPQISDAVQCTTSPASNGTEKATCTIGNPLKGQANKTLHIKFGTSELVRDFTIGILAKSVNVDLNSKDNTLKIPVVVKFEADLEVLGSSVPAEVIYEGKALAKDQIKVQSEIGPKLAQTIIVHNKGPSKVDGTEIQISVPSRYSNEEDSYLLYMLQVELTGASGSCLTEGALNELKLPLIANVTDSDKESKRKRRSTVQINLDCRSTTCKSFKCRFGLLMPGEKAEVTVRSRLWQSTFLRKKTGVSKIVTTAIVSIPDKRYTQPDYQNDIASIYFTVKPPTDSSNQKEELAWWVYFVAALGGVVLLGIAALILYKVGFFKRKRVKDISSPEVEQ